MAEILITLVDRGGVDLSPGISDTKAGDALCWKEDGWQWSQRERTNPNWRILRVAFTISELDAFVSLGDGDPKSQAVWKRKYKLDVTALPTPARNELLASRTGDGILVITGQRVTQYRSAIVQKPAR